ncbi:MAG TPA: hypothetical protein VEZ20_12130 [Allosphingosinicella sp.]|nr:hypothetical protein [Allosphingosinicella sp.]
MRVRTALLIACAALLAGCERREMPGWWPEALGGPIPHDRLADAPLAEKLHPNLEPLATLGRSGMRVSISPSFGVYHFVVDFLPRPHDCDLAARTEGDGCGEVVARYTVIGRDEAPPPAVRRFNFHVPEEEYREAVAAFDRLAERWRGSRTGLLDGTSIGIEQFRGGRLRSMRSNSSAHFEPDSPSAALAVHVHRLLLAYGPTGAVPRNAGFTVEPRDDDDYPCMAQTFDTPDPDGLGAGADACARQIAAPRR